jgi:phosphopantetheinyl transferase (holo-ACP synthase)
MIGGIEVRVVDNGRLAATMRRRESLTEMVFTTGGQSYGDRRRQAKRFAVCSAAKEAFLKADGGWSREGVPLRDVEVVHEVSGQPRLRLDCSPGGP